MYGGAFPTRLTKTKTAGILPLPSMRLFAISGPGNGTGHVPASHRDRRYFSRSMWDGGEDQDVLGTALLIHRRINFTVVSMRFAGSVYRTGTVALWT